MLSCLSLAQLSPGKGFVLKGVLALQGLVSEMELLIHGLGQESH